MNAVRSTLLASLIAALAVVTWSPAGAGEGGEESAAGHAAFLDAKCHVCHSVSAVGIEAKSKKPGPDLSGYSTDDLAGLARYLRKLEELDGQEHKKEFDGTDEELQAIVDWLSSLETPES